MSCFVWLQPLILPLLGQAMVENFGHAMVEITATMESLYCKSSNLDYSF
jgi:hypothetical protein